MDSFGRTIDYLRISVTDRCNERCLYCMPHNYKGWEPSADPLAVDEIVRIVRIASEIGFRKFRLTGGEPTLRQDLAALVHAMTAIPGVESVCLSTNGTRLASVARELHAAGLHSINVSLDTLNPELYWRITGGNLDCVLAGIRAARQAGFERLKLNCVLMRGINESDLWPLALFSAENNLPLRLIELMPLSRTDVLNASTFFSVGKAMERLCERDELVPQPQLSFGWGPARYYRLAKTGALIGFIGAISNPSFCKTCNKVRLTADGKLRPCLGQHGELDLRSVLRQSGGDDKIRAVLLETIRQKPREHQFRDQYHPCRPMTAIGG